MGNYSDYIKLDFLSARIDVKIYAILRYYDINTKLLEIYLPDNVKTIWNY